MKMHQLLVSLLLIRHNIVLDCGPVCPQQCSLVEPCVVGLTRQTHASFKRHCLSVNQLLVTSTFACQVWTDSHSLPDTALYLSICQIYCATVMPCHCQIVDLTSLCQQRMMQLT